MEVLLYFNYIFLSQNTYKEIKASVNALRDMEDECKSVIKSVATEYDDVDVKREMDDLNQYEETIKRGHKFSREEKTQLEAKIAICKEKTQLAMETFNELCGNNIMLIWLVILFLQIHLVLIDFLKT